jgi:hypothetical protein
MLAISKLNFAPIKHAAAACRGLRAGGYFALGGGVSRFVCFTIIGVAAFERTALIYYQPTVRPQMRSYFLPVCVGLVSALFLVYIQIRLNSDMHSVVAGFNNGAESAGSINRNEMCGLLESTALTCSNLNDCEARGFKILHCGACGACSNRNDIHIYHATSANLTNTVRDCAVLSVFVDNQAARRCLDENVGFTAGCREAWMENISCTRKSCQLVCLGDFIVYQVSRAMHAVGMISYDSLLRLSHPSLGCLRCDEINCGPLFSALAGANRRKCGIVSDIPRDTREVCTVMDLEYFGSARGTMK